MYLTVMYLWRIKQLYYQHVFIRINKRHIEDDRSETFVGE